MMVNELFKEHAIFEQQAITSEYYPAEIRVCTYHHCIIFIQNWIPISRLLQEEVNVKQILVIIHSKNKTCDLKTY